MTAPAPSPNRILALDALRGLAVIGIVGMNVHAFALPAFGLKIDAVPGRVNETWFRADRTGVFYGQCSELCGVDHAFMPIQINVVSRAEFAEVYASSVNAAGGVNMGIGTSVAAVTQTFTQGNITVTGNDLDLAINGNGFFEVTQPNGTMAYTRAGMFKLDRDGNIVNQQGGQLMGYPTDADGNRLSFDSQPLSLPTSAPIPARQTSNLVAQFNLDARAPVAASVTPPTPITTYGTSVVVYDQQGVDVPVNLYFVKRDVNTWEVFSKVPNEDPVSRGNIAFLPGNRPAGTWRWSSSPPSVVMASGPNSARKATTCPTCASNWRLTMASRASTATCSVSNHCCTRATIRTCNACTASSQPIWSKPAPKAW